MEQAMIKKENLPIYERYTLIALTALFGAAVTAVVLRQIESVFSAPALILLITHQLLAYIIYRNIKTLKRYYKGQISLQQLSFWDKHRFELGKDNLKVMYVGGFIIFLIAFGLFDPGIEKVIVSSTAAAMLSGISYMFLRFR